MTPLRALPVVVSAIALTLPGFFPQEKVSPPTPSVRTGLDNLVSQNFQPLAGKRIGLITNHTGITFDGRSNIELFSRAPSLKLAALFSPEHGLAGRDDDKIFSSTDPATGLPIHSLYGDTRRPTPEMLKGIDALVFDIQDAGVRFYTYITTMAYAMEEAAKLKIPFYVLDRPNPLDGVTIEGPMLDPDRTSFVGYFPMPVRYAMTLGELATMFNYENRIGADLHVIPLQRWNRTMRFEHTGLYWIPPSPNLRSLNAALLYPGIEPLQAAGLSVGRGTDAPFELVGAPWLRAVSLAADLNSRSLRGIRFVATRFTPRDGLYKGQLCEGLSLIITNRSSLRPLLVGLEIAYALRILHPNEFDLNKMLTLLGSADTIARLKRGESPEKIIASWAPQLAAFEKIRAKYLLYR